MASIEERITALDELPSLSPAVTELLSVIGDEDVGADDLEAIIVRDTPLCGMVLRAASSARSGFSQPASSLREGVSRLGSQGILKIAITQEAGDVLGGAGIGYGLDPRANQDAYLGGAIAADLIARKTGLSDPNTCFTAALLRDIGKIAMDLVVGEEELEAVLKQEHEGRGQVEIERAAFGYDHAEAGAALAKRWGLPDRLVEAIRYHHEPPSLDVNGDGLIDVIHCADMICIWLGLGAGHDGLSYSLSERSRQVIGLERSSLEGYMVAVVQELSGTLSGLDDMRGELEA